MIIIVIHALIVVSINVIGVAILGIIQITLMINMKRIVIGTIYKMILTHGYERQS